MAFCTEFGMGGGLESRCVGRVYGVDGTCVARIIRNPLILPSFGRLRLVLIVH